MRYNRLMLTSNSANSAGFKDITTESVSALIGEGRLDGEAAGELLKWADEHLKDLVKGTEVLERKMQVMLAVDLAILYLLFRTGVVVGSESPLAWGLLLCVWGSAAVAMFFLSWGLLAAHTVGLRGDAPANWSAHYLTLPENGGAGKNAGYIRAYLCAKQSALIRATKKTHARKLRLYKIGFAAQCVLLSCLVLGAFLRLWAGAPP